MLAGHRRQDGGGWLCPAEDVLYPLVVECCLVVEALGVDLRQRPRCSGRPTRLPYGLVVTGQVNKWAEGHSGTGHSTPLRRPGHAEDVGPRARPLGVCTG
jgi:hypothetical protein